MRETKKIQFLKIRTWLIQYLFITFFCSQVFSQITNDIIKESILEQSLENRIDMNPNELSDVNLLLDETAFNENILLNLNTCSNEDLQLLLVLNDFQIHQLLEHRKVNGPFISLEELQGIDGFEIGLIDKLSAFVCIKPPENTAYKTFKETIKKGTHQLFFRQQQTFENAKGYLTENTNGLNASIGNYYVGNKLGLNGKYRFFNGRNFSLGINMEKDPGETVFNNSQIPHPDFISMHLFYKKTGFLRTLAIGDYQAQFGQGLCFSSGFGPLKSSLTMNIKNNSLGFSPYTANDENHFLRGTGLTFIVKNLEISPFISIKNIDARIDTLILENAVQKVVANSVVESGLHRNKSELSTKQSIQERIIGNHLSFHKNKLNLGITQAYLNYSIPIEKKVNYYNQFEFNGQTNLNLSSNYAYLYRNFNFFGEMALSKNGGVARLNGVLIALDNKLSLSLLERKYDKNYQSFYSKSFGVNSNNINENGIYIGILAGPFKNTTINAYLDNYSFPWLKYQINKPFTFGQDLLFQVNYTVNKKTEMYARIRNQNQLIKQDEEITEINYLVNSNQINLRYHLSYEIFTGITLRNRVEYTKVSIENKTPEQGFLIYQDILYKSSKIPLSISVRYALFETDSYQSRIYAYENDAQYAFSTPAFFNKGNRTYINLKYTIQKKLTVWIRYAKTWYDDKNEIGSGYDMIEGNKKSDIKIQLRYSF